jgi:cobalt-zinc-cadmium resistance protein CzcA
LSQVASVAIKDGPNQVQREDAKRRIVVGFNVRGRDVESIVNELQSKVDKQMHFSPGYYTTYGGSFENLQAATQRLMIAVPIALLLIFILLYFAFGSVKQGLLIYSAIPLSAIGGILLLALRGMPFSISAGIGFIALFGVAVLNGIVLIAEFNRLKKQGMKNKQRIVLMGTKVRLRPVLMTASVASLGFLPMALSSGAGAEVQRPLATVVIGGLMIATFLTLFVLPVLYILFENMNLKKTKPHIAVILGILFSLGFLSNNGYAQTKITLQQAIDTALANNLSLKSEKLNVIYQQNLLKSGTTIPLTNVFGEFGQISSIYTDTKFGISQSIHFPTVYARHKSLLQENLDASKMSVAWKEMDLKRQVTSIYNTLSFLLEKKKLLWQTDSLYSSFLEKATQRFEKGESNVLEKTTAENQKGQMALQLKALEQDIFIMESQLQFALRTNTLYLPADGSFRKRMDFTLSSTETHPQIQVLAQQKQIAAANTMYEKSKLSPDLVFGYNNSSMRGTGADDKYYPSSKRFHSVQIGVGIPLFSGSQKAIIKASKAQENIAENNYQLGLQQLNQQREAAMAEYQKYLASVNWYEQEGLKNAATTIAIANQQFAGGEINYLDWVILVNQAIGIRSQYLDAVKNMNDAINQINYLNSK